LIRSATASLALSPFVAHALAREADRALGLVLRAELEPAGLLSEMARALAVDAGGALARIALWLTLGVALRAGLAWIAKRKAPLGQSAPLAPQRIVAWPLLLRPAMSLLALLSVGLQPVYPYAFTLPVALSQDWGIAQDLAALAALLALQLPAPRFPAPRAGELFLLSFLVYAALVPQSAWHWDSHPGNEPKTLRQAVALSHWLTFDAEAVSGPMEGLETRPLIATLPPAAAGFVRESRSLLGAIVRGEAGRDAIVVTRISRQVVRGKRGGVYSVLAPGPSILLAPALRADRELNRARGEPGRIAVSVLLFCALGALVVTSLFLLVRDATGRAGLAAALALGFALVPPFLFYFHQFYPEMPGALVLALAFRTLALRPQETLVRPWRLGILLAVLPWLHQKFLPVWLVLVATALFVAWRVRASPRMAAASGEPPTAAAAGVLQEAAARRLAAAAASNAEAHTSRLRVAAGLLLPTLASLWLFALYNFAITGSARPDALFLAWGPRGVSTARIGQGLLGLLLDARFGILPYVPVLFLAGAGLVTGGARRVAVVLPAALVYYLTVASADNWSGAVCNLGRYVMPIVPLAVALVGIALAPISSRRGALALALMLAAWTGLIALALWRDPHAANDSALLLAKSTYADGHVYIPGLFIRTWADAAPGLMLQVLAWLFLIGVVAFWSKRVERTAAAGTSPERTLAVVTALVLVVALALERSVTGTRTAPTWRAALSTGPETTLFLDGAAVVRGDAAVVGPGSVELVLRAPEGRSSLLVTMGGAGGWVHPAGRPPLELRASGTRLELPLSAYHEVRGRDRSATFSRGFLWLEREAGLRPAPMEPDGSEVR